MPTDIKSYEIKYGGVGKSPNTYTPYKMKGHELPGPNQRTPAVLKAFDASGGAINEEMVDKVSTTPGMPYAGGVGSSPAKGWFRDKLKDIGGGIGKALTNPLGAIRDKMAGGGGADPAAQLQQAAAAAQAGGKGGKLWGGIGSTGGVQPHGDEAHTGGGAAGIDTKAAALGVMGGEQAQTITKEQALEKNRAIAEQAKLLSPGV